MDQQAKKHLQDEFDAALEEKDQMVTVLQTQVRIIICSTKFTAVAFRIYMPVHDLELCTHLYNLFHVF